MDNQGTQGQSDYVPQAADSNEEIPQQNDEVNRGSDDGFVEEPCFYVFETLENMTFWDLTRMADYLNNSVFGDDFVEWTHRRVPAREDTSIKEDYDKMCEITGEISDRLLRLPHSERKSLVQETLDKMDGDGMRSVFRGLLHYTHADDTYELLCETVESGDMEKFQMIIDEYKPDRLCHPGLFYFSKSPITTVIEHWAAPSSKFYRMILDREILFSVLGILLEAGVDINASALNSTHTALDAAVIAQDVELCKWLHQHGARKRLLPNVGLMEACCRGNCAMVVFLLEQGIGLQHHDCRRCTESSVCTRAPLFEAVHGGHARIVEVLLEAYAQQGMRAPWQSVLCHAIHDNDNDEDSSDEDNNNDNNPDDDIDENIPATSAQERCATALLSREYQLWQKGTCDDFSPYHSYFHAIVSKGYRSLALRLASHDPRVLQEEWLIDNECPENVRDLSFLQARRCIPVALQVQCIIVIQSVLGPNSRTKLHGLPLPKPLKELYVQQITLASPLHRMT